ncbi:MAG: CHASE2 domain-containing protein [Magnetococcales bacterium]|nr:CHASE2 domain-containing protein [Magnetococcales bacterium]
MLSNQENSNRTILISAALLFCLLVLISSSQGWFQWIELAGYDQLVRWRSSPPKQSPPLTVIGITENDMNTLGWRLNDEVVAQALFNILEKTPRVIGLDIYREHAHPPGSTKLKEILTSNDHIILVEKFGNTEKDRIAAPEYLTTKTQVGFSDIVLDYDGIVRRSMIFLHNDTGRNGTSFALQLALRYMKSLGVKLHLLSNKDNAIQFGNAKLLPLMPNDGPYVDADNRGYQILLNYVDTPNTLPIYSLSDLLTNKVPTHAIKDKIVIIGATATSIKDLAFTPLMHKPLLGEVTHGVVLQATITNQLVNFALGKDTPTISMPDWIEAIWLIFWSVCGLLVGSRYKTLLLFLALLSSGLFLLSLSVSTAFHYHVWLPWILPAVAFIIGSLFSLIHVVYKERKLRQELILTQEKIRVKNELLAEHAQHLEEINQRKNRFFSIVSHDLRVPFMPLIRLSELLTIVSQENNPSIKEIHRIATQIEHSAQNTATLLDNLLDWSKLQMGHADSYEPTANPLSQAIEDTIDVYRAFIEEKNIKINQIDLSGYWILCDRDLFLVALRNIISNALKFTPSGGEITLSARIQPQGPKRDIALVEIMIRDTGIGISQEKLAQLFQLDRYNSTPGTDDEPGTGLGLILCQEVVEKNGGTIHIESKLNNGTTVRITVPATDPPAHGGLDQPPAINPGVHVPIVVRIGLNNAETRRQLTRTLSSLGCQVSHIDPLHCALPFNPREMILIDEKAYIQIKQRDQDSMPQPNIRLMTDLPLGSILPDEVPPEHILSCKIPPERLWTMALDHHQSCQQQDKTLSLLSNKDRSSQQRDEESMQSLTGFRQVVLAECKEKVTDINTRIQSHSMASAVILARSLEENLSQLGHHEYAQLADALANDLTNNDLIPAKRRIKLLEDFFVDPNSSLV